MTTVKAVVSGFMRMARCSGVVLALWLLVLAAALPMAVVMENTIRTDVGASAIHQDLRQGLDLGWLEEFHSRRTGLAVELRPVRVSPAMVFESLDLWLSGAWVSQGRSLVATGGLFLMVWVLVQGGVLTQLTSPEIGFRWSTFLAAGSTYFFRFLRLAALMGLVYYGVYKLAFWLFPAIERATRDVTVEKQVLGLYLLAALAIGILLACVHLVAEFARIATVREKRRSMILSVARSARLLAKHPLQAIGVFGFLAVLLGVLQVGYYWIAPGVTGVSPLAIVLAFLVGQLYLLFRWALRVARYGAEIELYDRWVGPHAGRAGSRAD